MGTRFKRALCKKLSAPPKTAKDVVAAVNSLQPDAPLRSVSFAGNHPPVVNAYNTFVAGIAKLDGELPPTIGRVGSASPNDAYAYFLERRNDHLVAEAGKLIARMKVDVDKKLVPLICASSTREASTRCARRGMASSSDGRSFELQDFSRIASRRRTRIAERDGRDERVDRRWE